MLPLPPSATTVLDLLPDVVCVVDAQAHLLFANPAFEHVLGYPPSQVLGQRVLTLLHPDDLAQTMEQVDKIMNGHHQRHFRNRYRHRDGHYVDMQWSARWHPEHAVRIAVGREVGQLRQAEQQLQHQANHDYMTGLPNLRHMLELLEQSIKRAGETGDGLALLFLDMDGFKAVNDCHGHEAGDQLLGQVANRLAGAAGQGHVAARVGGDEFVVIMPGCSKPCEALNQGALIRSQLNQPYLLPVGQVHLDVSIGAAVYRLDGNDPASLLACADRNMYLAKQASRASRA